MIRFDSMLRLSLPIVALAMASCDRPGAKLAITDVHAVATGTMASAYFTLGNSGGADRLVRVEAPETGQASLHDMSMEGGVMRMRAAPDGFALPAGEGLILAPQGRHVMIMSKTPIDTTQKMPLVLYFEKHRPMALAVPVSKPGEDEDAKDAK